MKYRKRSEIVPVLSMTILIASVILAGCIGDDQKVLINNTGDGETLIINYLDNMSILTKSDFPDFGLVEHKYAIASTNMSVTISTEGSHRIYVMDANEEVPNGYRIYGALESYNSSKNLSNLNETLGKNVTDRYIFLQYKVFDDDKRLNHLLNMTASSYIKNGYTSKVLGNNTNITYKGRVVIVESVNAAGLNRTIILFGYNNIIGTIGVQDSSDRSLNESLKVLDILNERLKVNTKEVKIIKKEVIRTFSDTENESNITEPNTTTDHDVTIN